MVKIYLYYRASNALIVQSATVETIEPDDLLWLRAEEETNYWHVSLLRSY